MKNIWIICQKELRSYFVSPVAYILFIIYAVIFGFFFWNMVGAFIYYSMEAQMRGDRIVAQDRVVLLQEIAHAEQGQSAEDQDRRQQPIERFMVDDAKSEQHGGQHRANRQHVKTRGER